MANSKSSPHRRHSKAFKLQVLEEKATGKLTVTELAAKHHIHESLIYNWQQRMKQGGEEALQDKPPVPLRQPELTPKAVQQRVVEVKKANPLLGSHKLQEHLARFEGIILSASTVNKILRRFGFKPADEVIQAEARKNDPEKQKQFEEEQAQRELEWQRFCRAHPNELWQIDLTTFYIRGQHRVWLIDIIDDHSRFIVGFSLVTEATAAAVMETLRGAFIKYGLPKEILTDQGTQFVAWKGIAQFQKFLGYLGIHHTVARSHHPQTCGKIESFHRNIKRELIDVERFASQEEATQRIAAYVDHYNYGRPHQGIGGFTPADRYFGIAEEVKRHLQERKALGNEVVAAGKPPAILLMGRLFGHMVRIQDEAGHLVVHLDGRLVYNADLTPQQITETTGLASDESDDAA